MYRILSQGPFSHEAGRTMKRLCLTHPAVCLTLAPGAWPRANIINPFTGESSVPAPTHTKPPSTSLFPFLKCVPYPVIHLQISRSIPQRAVRKAEVHTSERQRISINAEILHLGLPTGKCNSLLIHPRNDSSSCSKREGKVILGRKILLAPSHSRAQKDSYQTSLVLLTMVRVPGILKYAQSA